MSKNKIQPVEKMVACAARRKASGKHNLPGAVRRALFRLGGAELQQALPARASNVRPGSGGPNRMAKGTTPLDYKLAVEERKRQEEMEKKLRQVVRDVLVESGVVTAAA